MGLVMKGSTTGWLRRGCGVVAIASAACGHSGAVGVTLAASPLPGTDGATHAVQPGGDTRLTVLVFFADHCPCQAAHDGRLRDLYALYHPRGVDIFAVDSETDATAERDASEAAKRAYPFPILIDHGGALARRVGAVYATETFVIDRSGTVRYHGGIDSDKRRLHEDAIPFLRDAMDDLLAQRPLRRTESKALGCALQTF
jgi:peroxiredoxin